MPCAFRSLPGHLTSALSLLALLLVTGLLAPGALPTLAQEADLEMGYALPSSWQGDAIVPLRRIAEIAPPFQSVESTGAFLVHYLPAEGEETIRILPDGEAERPGSTLTLVWPITGNGDGPPLDAGAVFVLGATARAYSPPDGVMLTIREFDGKNWSSSSVPMQDVSWTDYSVLRKIGEDAVEVQVGLEWEVADANAWLEFRNMKLAVLPAEVAAQMELSPEDTPTPVGTPGPPRQANSAPRKRDAPPSARNLLVVTSTPTPPDLFAAATAVAVATESALTVGTATPTPDNMVTATPTATPMVVTATTAPANAATAAYHAAFATSMAATTGTPTPLPESAVVKVVLPTPTPVQRATTRSSPASAPRATVSKTPTAIAVTYDQLVFLTSTPTPVFPQELVGKILFLSDHLATNSRNPDAYMINPDGTGLSLMASREFYDRAKARDAYSPDKRFHAYSIREPYGSRSARIQVFYDDATYASTHHQLTYFGAGTAWAPAWSPQQDAVALVSSDSDNDEIWLVRRNEWPPMQLTKNAWEWDRSPSFSPDGTQIVFESNRVTGTRQIWIMDASGQNQRQVTNFPFETWDPVWVKYADD